MRLTELEFSRVRSIEGAPNPAGDTILYWMRSSRRLEWNFALQHAVSAARRTDRGLLILDILFCDDPHASLRHHHFALQGMAAIAAGAEKRGSLYYPYAERRPGEGLDLLQILSRQSAEIFTDDFPTHSFEERLDLAAKRLNRKITVVDSNGLLPMKGADRCFPTAFAFRRHLQKALPPHLQSLPERVPLADAQLPSIQPSRAALTRYPPDKPDELLRNGKILKEIPIDHTPPPVTTGGGLDAARRALSLFVEKRLQDYPEKRNEPEEDGASGLSPYLHFGHISVYEIFDKIAQREGWTPDRLAFSITGKRTGWWGMSREAEAFLDQLVTWREVGFNMCAFNRDYDRFESLPPWAQQTLHGHEKDLRPRLYSLRQLEEGTTEDPLWNSAQRQLLREGTIHNYLRMLWGKKILEWSPSPREALSRMIHLNDRYALDGSDPNSYSGIFWCLGRYDRAWGPERPIFGKIRYMSSENTARKYHVKGYIDRYQAKA